MDLLIVSRRENLHRLFALNLSKHWYKYFNGGNCPVINILVVNTPEKIITKTKGNQEAQEEEKGMRERGLRFIKFYARTL